MKQITVYQDETGVNHATEFDAAKAELRYMFEDAAGNDAIGAKVAEWVANNAKKFSDAIQPLISVDDVAEPPFPFVIFGKGYITAPFPEASPDPMPGVPLRIRPTRLDVFDDRGERRNY